MIEIFKTAGISTTIVIPLTGFIFFLFRKWIITKITKSVEHSFSEKLEILKSELSAQSAQQLAMYSAGASAQAAGAERRIAAIEKIWAYVQQIREAANPFAELSYLTEEEYFTSPRIKSDNSSDMEIMAKYSEDTQNADKQLRPFLTPRLWRLYYIYSIFCGRLVYLEAQVLNKDLVKVWFHDKATINLIKEALSQEEIDKALSGTFKSPEIIKDLLENKILAETHFLVNGRRFSEEASALSEITASIKRGER